MNYSISDELREAMDAMQPKWVKIDKEISRWCIDDNWFVDRYKNKEFVEENLNGLNYWLIKSKNKEFRIKNSYQDAFLKVDKSVEDIGGCKKLSELKRVYLEKTGFTKKKVLTIDELKEKIMYKKLDDLRLQLLGMVNIFNPISKRLEDTIFEELKDQGFNGSYSIFEAFNVEENNAIKEICIKEFTKIVKENLSIECRDKYQIKNHINNENLIYHLFMEYAQDKFLNGSENSFTNYIKTLK